MDQYVFLWDVRKGEPIARLHGHSSVVFSVNVGRKGKLFASGGSDQAIILWETDSGRIVKTSSNLTGMSFLWRSARTAEHSPRDTTKRPSFSSTFLKPHEQP